MEARHEDIPAKALVSPGQSLNSSNRGALESLLGVDFSRVRIDTDTRAAESAEAMHAQAFTIGHNVVFGEGRHAPQTAVGKQLLAHDLAHVVQQGASGERVQRRIIDGDAHVTCRPTRPGAVATLQSAEDAAIELAENAADWTRWMLDPHILERYSSELGFEGSALRVARDILWRRFHLDFNDRRVRDTLLPILAQRYELVAGWIRRDEARYICGPVGVEPPGDCTTNPGHPIAWTTRAGAELCEAFWVGLNDEAGTIMHEGFHRGFGFLHDCEADNFYNVVCYEKFAREAAGTATPADYADCCRPPLNPLLPLRR